MNNFVEEFLFTKKMVSNSLKKWQKYKIGNFVTAKVLLIKDYGVIMTVEEGVTGFITNENLFGVDK